MITDEKEQQPPSTTSSRFYAGVVSFSLFAFQEASFPSALPATGGAVLWHAYMQQVLVSSGAKAGRKEMVSPVRCLTCFC